MDFTTIQVFAKIHRPNPPTRAEIVEQYGSRVPYQIRSKMMHKTSMENISDSDFQHTINEMKIIYCLSDHCPSAMVDAYEGKFGSKTPDFFYKDHPKYGKIAIDVFTFELNQSQQKMIDDLPKTNLGQELNTLTILTDPVLERNSRLWSNGFETKANKYRDVCYQNSMTFGFGVYLDFVSAISFYDVEQVVKGQDGVFEKYPFVKMVMVVVGEITNYNNLLKYKVFER